GARAPTSRRKAASSGRRPRPNSETVLGRVRSSAPGPIDGSSGSFHAAAPRTTGRGPSSTATRTRPRGMNTYPLNAAHQRADFAIRDTGSGKSHSISGSSKNARLSTRATPGTSSMVAFLTVNSGRSLIVRPHGRRGGQRGRVHPDYEAAAKGPGGPAG